MAKAKTAEDSPTTEKKGAACKNPPKKPKVASSKTAEAAPKPEATSADKPETKPEESKTVAPKNSESAKDLPAKVDEKEPENDEPEPKVYTPEEIEDITTKVETYSDQTPKYEPKHMLSPEFSGTSIYERGILDLRDTKRAELERLGSDSDATKEELLEAKDKLRFLDHYYENYHLGMNVFRTAKGGRSKLRV